MKQVTIRRVQCWLMACGLSLALPALAKNIEVTTFADVLDGSDGLCSFREAVIAANTDDDYNECEGGMALDTIVLQTGTYTLKRPSGWGDDVEGGDLDIDEDLIILGKGSRLEPDFSDGFDDRFFEIHNDVRIEGLILADGYSAEPGGAILVGKNGSLELVGTLFFDNGSQGSGGAVRVEDGGELFLDGARMYRSVSGGAGGAISVENGSVEIRGLSMLVTNRAVVGGGIHVGDGGRVEAEALRLINNSATDGGAFVVDGGEIELEKSGLLSNKAEWLGSVATVENGSAILRRTLVINSRFTGDEEGVIGHSLLVSAGGVAELVETRIERNEGNLTAVADGRLSLVGSLVAENRSAGDPSLLPLVAAVAGVESSVVDVVNSTVSGNEFTIDGRSYGVVGADRIANSTITGITVGGTWSNSILDGGCQGFYKSLGYNVIHLAASSGLFCKESVALGAGLDLWADAQLVPLAWNGGFTRTHALMPTSPAIDFGNPQGCVDPAGALIPTDQTGHPRPVPTGGRCDAGAYEYDPNR